MPLAYPIPPIAADWMQDAIQTLRCLSVDQWCQDRREPCECARCRSYRLGVSLLAMNSEAVPRALAVKDAPAAGVLKVTRNQSGEYWLHIVPPGNARHASMLLEARAPFVRATLDLVAVKPSDRCQSCNGTGRNPHSDIVHWLPCHACNGTGKIKTTVVGG